ncbi:MAG: hypothetical protein HYS98_08390 [Deltaproteobacteria bacterium]|nr:hypothetical protein [Deltaproteobacteria bacterium]
MSLKRTIEEVGTKLFSCPTAPYKEFFVQEFAETFCNQHNIPNVRDQWGNIWVGTDSMPTKAKNSKLVFVAHMDHPGFHIRRIIKSGLWEAQWFGGGPTKKIKNAKVMMCEPTGSKISAKIKSFTLNATKTRVEKLVVQLDSKDNLSVTPTNFFGYYDFPGFIRRKTKIYTKAADDIGGVLMVLLLAQRLKSKSKKIREPFLGLLTRAEEVGFQGALGSVFSYRFPKHLNFISVETSNYRAGAHMGAGPIIRLGDRMTSFDPGLLFYMRKVALWHSKNYPKFKYQTKLMDGGTCEASAFNLFNLKAAGLAVPLGNYHNEKDNGAPGPEFIDINDVENLILLCETLVLKFDKKDFYWDAAKKILKKSFIENKARLKE